MAVSRRGPRLPRVLTRPLFLVPAVIVLLIVVAGVIFAMQASKAKTALNRAADQAQTLKTQISDGNSAGATSTLAGLQSSTSTARSNTSGPLWKVAAHVPFVGDSVQAVREVSDALDDITQQGLPPVVKVSGNLDSDLFKPKNGQFDVAVLSKISPSVQSASTVLTRDQVKIASIDSSSLIGPLQAPVKKLKSKVSDAQQAARSASVALQVLPTMLGGNGTRHYVLLFQNNAELRATGGVPGAFAVIKVKDGSVSITKQGTNDTIGAFDKSVIPVTADEKQTYGPTLATDLRDSNLTPNYPRTAQIVAAMVHKRLGTTVDGVISLDPVALSYVLKGTGNVTVDDGTVLTPTNAVQNLLNTVYARISDPKQQDVFFADAARKVFDKVLSGSGNSREVLSGLSKATDENRVLVWSAHADEESRLADTGVGGRLVGKSSVPRVGVYLSDATASKMEYYLRFSSTVKSTQCLAGGKQALTVTTTLVSDAPSDASDLPSYIAGNGTHSPTGDMRLNSRIFAPYGGAITSVTVDGKKTIAAEGKDQGRPASVYSLLLKPGKTMVITTTMVTGAKQSGAGVLSSTPGVQSLANDTRFASACG